MRELTDLEMGSVAGGESLAEALEVAVRWCEKSPGSSFRYEDRDNSANVGGSGGVVGGSVGGTLGGFVLEVKCAGRVEDAARDKEDNDEES